MKDVLARVEKGELDLLANLKAVGGLRELPRALEAVDRGEVSGKIVLYPQAPELPFRRLASTWDGSQETSLLGDRSGQPAREDREDSMRDHVIGIDIGTTGTKTGIYDREGRLVGDAFEESILRYPGPGQVEQDPDEISVRPCARSAGAGLVRSRCLADRGDGARRPDGRHHGHRRDWNPVTHYDSWLDTRCAPWLEELRPHEDEIIRTCGMALAFNHAPRFLYWRDKPDIWARIHSFIQPAAYVAGRLAGLSGADAFTDRTYLVFSGFGSGEKAEWNEALLDRFRLDRAKFPRIVEPWEIIGQLTARWAGETGLPAGCRSRPAAATRAPTCWAAGWSTRASCSTPPARPRCSRPSSTISEPIRNTNV
jgi:hypothetical protein